MCSIFSEPSKVEQVVETQAENSTQNQEKENIIAQQGQEVDKSKENSQKQEQEQEQEQTEEEEEEEENANEEDRANFSTRPGKRSAPKPKTG